MSNEHHDRRSLLMHQEAVRMLLADPMLASKALATLERWDSQVSEHSKPLRDRWVEIIKARDWSAATEESERGNQLRQASPLSCLLPNDVRLAIIEATKRSSV